MNGMIDIIKNIGPRIFMSLKHNTLTWSTALGELCDNSYDAGASKIIIDFQKNKTLVVSDNGRGCDDLQRMLTLGDHYNQKTTKLGRHGVGLKETACWLWGRLIVETIRNGVCNRVMIDWEQLCKSESGEIALLNPERSEPGQVGTVLTFKRHIRKIPSYDYLYEKLGYLFFPGIKDGRKIIIKPLKRKEIEVEPWEPPTLTDEINDDFEVMGKKVKLRAGIVPSGTKNTKSGFTYTYQHRVVEPHCGLGAEGMSVSRICGIVELGEEWGLSKNKTEISDEHKDHLAREIFNRCRWILERSAHQAETIKNSALENEVSEALQGILKIHKEKRINKNINKGTVKPKYTGRKRRKATNVQPGDAISKIIKNGAIRMEWHDFDDDSIGFVDVAGPAPTVRLNKEHKYLKSLRESENKEAIVSHCLWLLADTAVKTKHGKQMLIPGLGEMGNLIEIVSFVTSKQELSEEQKESKKVAAHSQL